MSCTDMRNDPVVNDCSLAGGHTNYMIILRNYAHHLVFCIYIYIYDICVCDIHIIPYYPIIDHNNYVSLHELCYFLGKSVV